MHAVDNRDQAPIRPGPRGHTAGGYSPSSINMLPVATFVWSNFRECDLSETRRLPELQAP